MRYLFFLLPLLFTLGCKTVVPVVPFPEPEVEPPAGVILTVLLYARAGVDSLEVYDVIRGPGRLRKDYPATFTGGEEGDLRFSFLDAENRVIRQHSEPFPGPNRYEAPSEDGRLTSIELPGEERLIVLKTQDGGRLEWVVISGYNDVGTRIDQRVSLGKR